ALQTFCTDILVKHPTLVFDSDDFFMFKKMPNTPDLPSDIKQWTEKNFLDLKTTLGKCIPSIRYFQMPEEGIVVKVKPCQQILGLNLWDNISTFMALNAPIISTILLARKKTPVQLPVRE
ncbi:15686_t:CDS:2, partial [Gigaspora rosea]